MLSVVGPSGEGVDGFYKGQSTLEGLGRYIP